MKNIDLASRIATCACDPCRALTALRNDAGSRLRIMPHAPGRLCEMAVVAAAGAAGLTAAEVVEKRRAYQQHLGLVADGPLKDAPTPGHISHAIKYSNHTPGIKPSHQPIHLGRAHAYKVDERFYLTWEPVFVPTSVNVPAPIDVPQRDEEGKPVPSAIEIDWPAGPERFTIDLANLGPDTQVRRTEQWFKASQEHHVYETTSLIEAQPGGRFKIEIHYDPERNAHIDPASSWWGTTTLVLGAGDQLGTVTWKDDEGSENDGTFRFRVVPAVPEQDTDQEREADERGIEASDLSPTDKRILINARRGQGLFRAKVLQVEPRCRLTGTADPAHLRASHIKPWAKADDRERLDGNNGLMLAPHVDHLFDRALISFEDNGRLLWLNDQVHGLLVAWGIDVQQQTMRPRPFSSRQCRYLREHRARFERQRTS
jgi:hypothetical protein